MTAVTQAATAVPVLYSDLRGQGLHVIQRHNLGPEKLLRALCHDICATYKVRAKRYVPMHTGFQQCSKPFLQGKLAVFGG
jgi:hypothetical protein